MEGHDHNMDMQGGGAAAGQGGGGPVNSRWNPTKEQISMLENLYSQGIRTPSAEQIQQITRRLRVYGHIEGKNVFYWFQNHKARQRQKQKQESMANYLNHYLHNKPHLHHHQPLFAPPPCSNVVCGPYYLPQTELGFYPQTPKVLLAGAVKRRQRTDQKMDHKTKSTTTYAYQNHTAMSPELYNNGSTMMMKSSDFTDYYGIVHGKTNNGDDGQETLPLFPLHPTGILRQKGSVSAENSVITNTPSCSSFENGVDEGFGGDNVKPFFDFFHGSLGVCESD